MKKLEQSTLLATVWDSQGQPNPKELDIYESSLATKIEFENDSWITNTKKGSIKSKKLLIAANAYLQSIIGIPSIKIYTCLLFSSCHQASN